jgi:protein-arginine kinase activator protein McsA
MKECSKCHQFLPNSEFYKDTSKKDGLRSYCRKCQREHNREYRKSRLDNNLCYDCGRSIPSYWDRKRFCPDCYKKRLKMNEQYERKRVSKGLCRQCGKNPIDYTRSKLHCSECLDKRNELKQNGTQNDNRLKK